jgi:hypothetical protein
MGSSALKAFDNLNWSAMMTTCQSGFLAVTDKTNTIGYYLLARWPGGLWKL